MENFRIKYFRINDCLFIVINYLLQYTNSRVVSVRLLADRKSFKKDKAAKKKFAALNLAASTPAHSPIRNQLGLDPWIQPARGVLAP